MQAVWSACRVAPVRPVRAGGATRRPTRRRVVAAEDDVEGQKFGGTCSAGPTTAARAARGVLWAAASVVAFATTGGTMPAALACAAAASAPAPAAAGQGVPHFLVSQVHASGRLGSIPTAVAMVEGILNFAIEQIVVCVGVVVKIMLGPCISVACAFMGRMWEPGDIFFIFCLAAILEVAAKWLRKVTGIGNEAVDSPALMASSGSERRFGRLGKDIVWVLEVPMRQLMNLLFLRYALDNLANYNEYYATVGHGFEGGRISGLDDLAASRDAISSALRAGFAALVALDVVKRFLPRAPFLEWQPELEPVLRRTLEFAIIGTALTTMMDALGFPMQSILAIGGVSGFAIGLASKDVISNFFGGLMLIILQPFRPGDKIVCDKFVGVVQRIGWYQCVLLKDNRTSQYVPNQVFVSQIVTNISRRTHDYFESEITVQFDDIAKIPDILRKIQGALGDIEELDSKLPVKVFCKAYTDVGAQIHISCCFQKTGASWRTQDMGNKLIADAVLGCGARFANLS